jgi:glutaminyl-peptide cyclotransferase
LQEKIQTLPRVLSRERGSGISSSDDHVIVAEFLGVGAGLQQLGRIQLCLRYFGRVCGMKRIRSALVVILVAYGSILLQQAGQAQIPPEYTFVVIRAFPHDTSAYTQGLSYRDGFLYEGTGLYGRSSLRKVNLETGTVVRRIDLEPEFFGEGITIFRDKIVQLTWKSHIGFVYDLKTFHLLQRFSYSGEGWGLAANDRELYMSDGTSEIRVLDAETFKEKRHFTVHDGSKPVDQLNELEFVEGQIFANVWHTNLIARISPQTGAVLGWINLTGLLSPVYHLEPEAVLNGIAYDSARKRLFVTGKLWPSVFEIKLSPKQHR